MVLKGHQKENRGPLQGPSLQEGCSGGVLISPPPQVAPPETVFAWQVLGLKTACYEPGCPPADQACAFVLRCSTTKRGERATHFWGKNNNKIKHRLDRVSRRSNPQNRVWSWAEMGIWSLQSSQTMAVAIWLDRWTSTFWETEDFPSDPQTVRDFLHFNSNQDIRS